MAIHGDHKPIAVCPCLLGDMILVHIYTSIMSPSRHGHTAKKTTQKPGLYSFGVPQRVQILKYGVRGQNRHNCLYTNPNPHHIATWTIWARSSKRPSLRNVPLSTIEILVIKRLWKIWLRKPSQCPSRRGRNLGKTRSLRRRSPAPRGSPRSRRSVLVFVVYSLALLV